VICKIINEKMATITLMDRKKKILKTLGGFLIGVINSLLGRRWNDSRTAFKPYGFDTEGIARKCNSSYSTAYSH
jgi:hypothetical protein